MSALLSAAGRAFLRAFLAAILVYATGVLAAPNLNRAYLLGVAALAAALAAGFRSIQAYLPKLSIATYLPAPYGAPADAFLHGFLGALIVSLTGWLGAPDLATARSFAVAAIVGAVTAGVRAVQALLTTGEHPSPGTGVDPPPNP